MLWDNSTRFIFTLAAAVIGLVAYFLIPTRKQIEERAAESYKRFGKWLLFAFAFIMIGLAGVLAWEWFRYRVHDIWVGGNLVLYAVLGPALLAVNILIMRAMKSAADRQGPAQVELVAADTIEVFAMEGTQPGLITGETPAPQLSQPAQPSPPADDTTREAPKP